MSRQPETVNHQPEIAVVDDKHLQQYDVGHIDDKIPLEDPVIVSHADQLTLWQTIKTYPRATFFCAFAAFGAISDGYQYALPGSIVALRGFIDQFGSPNAQGVSVLNSQHVALWGAFYTIAYIVVLPLGTWPADKFGRKPLLFVIQALMAIACLVEMFATNWGHWAIAKVLNGLSVGLNQLTLMTYISEICPSQSRGAMLGTYSIWWGIGKFLASITLKIMSTAPADLWRRAVYSEWVFTGVALIVWLVVPENPRWYCERGRDDLAKKSLARFNRGVKSYDMESEYGIIQKEVADGKIREAQNKEVTILHCFKGTNLRRTFISFAPFAWQQWGGNAVINTYTAYFFQLAGLSDPFLASVIINIIGIYSTLQAPYIIERFGRRQPILLAGGVMIITLYLIGGLLRAPTLAGTFGLGVALIAIACVWELFYVSTLGVIGYVYLGETSTVILRAKTTGVAASGTGFLNLVVNYCTPLMLGDPSFGPSGTMLFYGSTCLVWTVIAYFTIPETKGRSYLELDELFERKISARKFAETETKVDVQKQQLRHRGQV